jgi:hypothetical protein
LDFYPPKLGAKLTFFPYKYIASDVYQKTDPYTETYITKSCRVCMVWETLHIEERCFWTQQAIQGGNLIE